MTELPKMVNYLSGELGISIWLPENWNLQVISEGQFRIFGNPESGFEEYFEEYRPTMSYLLAEPENDAEGWFENLITESGNKMLQDYNEYQSLAEEHCQIADRPAYFRQYEWRDTNTGLRLSQLQSLIHKNSSSFYLINSAVLQPLEGKYMPIFKAILQSTQIIPTGSLN